MRLASCVLAALLAACSQKPAPGVLPAQRPNLLLITVDTTRADHVGCYGARTGATPVMDALAARGVRFENALSNIPLTRPSHTTLLTGLLPQRHGVWSNGPYRLDPKWLTLAERFQKSGYRTGAVIASFVLTRSFGLERGFDVYDDSLRDTPGADPEKTADQVAASAQALLQDRIQPPFFLWLHFYDPHFPYTPPSGFAGSPYDGEIAFMDRQIGVVLDSLQNRGQLTNTIVVVAGDHGEGLGEHGEATHGYFLYDSVMRVPLIMAGPGIPAGKTIAPTVSLSDLTPTMLEAFQLRQPQDRFDGKSLWKGVQGAALQSEPVVLENRSIHFQFGWAALIGLRTDAYKWIGSPEEELYNIQEDPHELTNLAPQNKSQVAAMHNLDAKVRPKVESSGTSSGALNPEEESKLASLGYISGGSANSSDVFLGPDSKRFSGIMAKIDDLIHARQVKDMTRVEELVGEVLKVDPENLFALRCEGEMLILQRRFAEALTVLKRVVEKNENHPETFAYLGTAYEKTGEPAQALFWYQKAATPPWIYWPALESMARIAAASPALLSRDACLQKLAAVQPSSAREYTSVARAYALLSAYDDALLRYRKALEITPRIPEAQVGQAQMLQKLGRLPEAERALMQMQSPTVESRYVLATVLLQEGRKPAACTNFVESLRMQPRNINLLLGVAAGLQNCELPDQAAQCYDRILQSEPGNRDALQQLARLEEARGNTDRARALYRRLKTTQ